jgi:hypothetical protein
MHQLTDEQLAIITTKKTRRARCRSFRGSNRGTAGPDSNVGLAFLAQQPPLHVQTLVLEIRLKARGALTQ